MDWHDAEPAAANKNWNVASNDARNGFIFQESNDTDLIDVGHEASGGGDRGCRNCGQDGHYARECTEPRKSSGGCFNCGEEGHSKADCHNPRVERPFTGECRECGEVGHPAFQCPKRVCKNCGEPGHKLAECGGNRAVDRTSVQDMEPDAAWAMLQQASRDKDLDDFKTALEMYAKALPDATYADIENGCRNQDFSIYLIALEKEMPLTLTNVNLQGKTGCKYTVGFYFSPKPKRSKFAEGWPSNSDENLERLADAGRPMEVLLPLCRRCNELGHISKNCTQGFMEPTDQPSISCSNCNEVGHRLRDCTKPRVDANVCRNCKQPGHRSAECTEPRSAEGVECKRCSEVGHFAKDCPNSGPSGCRNCGEEGHIAKECTQPRNPATVTCRNCDEVGHFSKDCPKPRDYSRVECRNCGQKGHTAVRCDQPAADAGGSDDGRFGVGDGGVGGFEAAAGAGAANGGWQTADNGAFTTIAPAW